MREDNALQRCYIGNGRRREPGLEHDEVRQTVECDRETDFVTPWCGVCKLDGSAPNVAVVSRLFTSRPLTVGEANALPNQTQLMLREGVQGNCLEEMHGTNPVSRATSLSASQSVGEIRYMQAVTIIGGFKGFVERERGRRRYRHRREGAALSFNRFASGPGNSRSEVSRPPPPAIPQGDVMFLERFASLR